MHSTYFVMFKIIDNPDWHELTKEYSDVDEARAMVAVLQQGEDITEMALMEKDAGLIFRRFRAIAHWIGGTEAPPPPEWQKWSSVRLSMSSPDEEW